MVEIMKIMVPSSKRSPAGTAALSAPDPAAGHRQPKPPPGTPGHYRQVWVNLLWSHCFFLLGPDVYKFRDLRCLSNGGPDGVAEILQE